MAIHIIGDQDTVLGYRFAGVTGAPVATAEEAQAAFRAAVSDPAHRILLLTERVERMVESRGHRPPPGSSAAYIVVIEGHLGRRRPPPQPQDLIFGPLGIRIVRGE